MESSLERINALNESAHHIISALVIGKLGHLSKPVRKSENGEGALIGRSRAGQGLSRA
jgi:hypothetical protein